MKEKSVSVHFWELLKYEVVIPRPLAVSMGIAAFITLTALGAFIRIPLPFTPVPITMQTFFVLLSGAMLGSRNGAISQLLYVFLGVLGLPIFAGANGGTAYLCGATGGYFIGFVIAAWIAGRMLKGPRGVSYTAMTFALASMVIYTFGSAWLMLILKCGIVKAVTLGVLPFIVGDIIKLTSAALVYKNIGKYVQVYKQ